MNYLTDRDSPLLWGSHLPVLQSIIDAFPITGALELGAGIHSTGVLFRRLNAVVSVENKLGWLEKVRETIVEDENHRIAHFPFDHPIKLQREEIGPEQLAKATAFYRANMQHKPNLLFIDCFRGYRLQAIIDLHMDFDVVVYHDAQPRHDFRYGYSRFVPPSHFMQFVDRTLQTHTGMLITKKFESLMPTFLERLPVHHADHAAKYGVTSTVNLDRIR